MSDRLDEFFDSRKASSVKRAGILEQYYVARRQLPADQPLSDAVMIPYADNTDYPRDIAILVMRSLDDCWQQIRADKAKIKQQATQ